MIASAFGVLFYGFAYGMLLFILSVGLSGTLGVMDFVNLAHCSLGMYRLCLIGVSIAITAVLVAGLEFTRFGAQVRAAVDNQRMARGLGIDVDRVFAVTFALGSGLAGLGGALAIEIVGLDHAFAFTYLISVLIVVAVGGVGALGRPLFPPPALPITATCPANFFSPPSGPLCPFS